MFAAVVLAGDRHNFKNTPQDDHATKTSGPLVPTLETDHPPQNDQTLHDGGTIQHWVEHAAHLLPSQGPITVFVHHNTLHSFEDLGFDKGVQAGARLFGCNAYLPENRYRQVLRSGRIRVEDLEAVLQEDVNRHAQGGSRPCFQRRRAQRRR
jgi:hypothetical protein